MKKQAAAGRRPSGPDPWNIDDRYVDVKGRTHLLPDATRAALLKAMGVSPRDRRTSRGQARAQQGGKQTSKHAGKYADVVVLRGAGQWRAEQPGQLRLEDGTTRRLAASEQIELPLGYHEFTPARDRSRRGKAGSPGPIRIIAAPATCHLPDEPRLWGWAVQLYATRSRRSWGIGDLGDLAQVVRWSRKLGARALMVNPLTAATPVLPIEPSPYFPSSRRFRNPIYIRVEDAPGARANGEVIARLARAARGLNDRRRIDRDAVFTLKMHALETCFAGFADTAAFRGYRALQGQGLTDFATYCAIAERHGKDWRVWPRRLRNPGSPAVAVFARRHASRVRFHAWLQWLLDVQLQKAARGIRLIQDLPIGIDAGGADAWCWQDLLASDVSVGVPPDEYNPPGQDWGLIPFVPHKLRAAGYQPFIETIRATARHAGGLRIDHVMGLFALYWIPRNHGGPANGGYVRTRADEMLAIIALESQRAGAFVVGEDLGTVAPGVREKMAEIAMLSYRLVYFEDGPPRGYPELALSTVTTHDLPTVAGLWTGADLARTGAAGIVQNTAGLKSLRAKLATLAGARADSPAEAVIQKVHAALAAAPSRVLLATLDDALAVEERPNIPGAPADWPNWSVALPVPIEDFGGRRLPARVARALSHRPSGHSGHAGHGGQPG